MSKTIQEERLRWVQPIANSETTLAAAASICPYSKRTLERWVAAYRKGGAEALVPQSTQPKSSPRETCIRTKEEIIALRKKTGLCAQKIHWRLKKRGLLVPVRTIGKILKDEGLVRKYRQKKMKIKYLRVERKPGELFEIDVKHVPRKLDGAAYFQYTAIDTASRWRYLRIFEYESTLHSIEFLKDVIQQFPHTITAVKTDNHATFTNYYTGCNKRSDMTVKRLHPLDKFCAQQNIIHYLIDKGSPAQNGTVERSHREDQEKFYDKKIFHNVKDLKRKIRLWNNYYNNLEHCSLDGQTPNEVLLEYVHQNPPKVLA